jgi:hypothetical protein
MENRAEDPQEKVTGDRLAYSSPELEDLGPIESFILAQPGTGGDGGIIAASSTLS